MSTIILVILFLIVIVWLCCKTVSDYAWNQKPLDNFHFIYRGKEYWYSRSVATVPFVFCKDDKGVMRVLANKRGSGTPDYQGCWNVPCGYLVFNVDGQDNCIKEIYEETGVNVPKEKLKFFGLSTSPSENKQNVSIRYYAILDGVISDYPLTNAHSEKNEVDDIKWISLDDIGEYQWAFGHDKRINEIREKIFNNN